MPLADLLVTAVVTGLMVAPIVASWLAARETRETRARMTFLREAAAEAGVQELVRWGEALISGSAGAFQVRLSRHREAEAVGREKHRTRLDISGVHLAPGLWLRPEPRQSPSENPREVALGDDAFDRAVSVQGPPSLALALLDAELRQAVSALMRGRLQVQGHEPLSAHGTLVDNVLRLELSDREQGISQAVRAGLDLAGRLAEPQDVAARLLERLRTEQDARVRLTVLLTLLREFEGRPASRQAAAAAREDPHPDLRLRAGIALGSEGRDVLLGVALDPAAEDATRASAVAALGYSLTVGQATDLLEQALVNQRLATARACLKALGQRGGPEAIRALVQVLAAESGTVTWPRRAFEIDAAAALAATGDPAAEPALLAALASPSKMLAAAAAQALGRVGTREAVAPLRELEARDAAVRGAARQAIAEIHSRLAGAAQGQLSLAESEAGRLSLAEGAAGRLSLSDEKPGVGEA